MRAPVSTLPVRFDDASVIVGSVTILDSLSLTLTSGAPTVLIGPNGSGKTTFLRAAMGLIRPTRGRINGQGLTRCHRSGAPSCFSARRRFAAALPPSQIRFDKGRSAPRRTRNPGD